MASECELPEPGKVSGVALSFPVTDSSSPSTRARIPRRVRQRLSECKAPLSAEEIEAKLRDADLRRQQYLERLSSKARTKHRSPSLASCNEDRSQRLEAKLRAAGEKRSTILKNARMRLARLDELRQAAKISAEMRFLKRREELGTKVRSRIQQAEINRMLLLKAYSQRRVAAKKRAAKVVLQRMFQENAYRKCVQAAILQKRAAAEKKRLGLVEAERIRARAIVARAREVSKFVFSQRESERKIHKAKLDDQLLKAKTERSKYLRLRGSSCTFSHTKWNEVHLQRDLFSRKLARCWRRFVILKRTTFDLANEYVLLGVNEKAVRLMPFEQLAGLIESPNTLQRTKAFLDRLELRFAISHPSPSGSGNIDNLLKQLASPNKKKGLRNPKKSKDTSKTPHSRKLKRYPTRVLLCAYMILGHPDAVLSGQGEADTRFVQSAENLVHELECLIKVILAGHAATEFVCPPKQPYPELTHDSVGSVDSSHSSSRKPFRSQLAAFDSSWCSYLSHFVAWKVKDVRPLEKEMMRAANQLELYMMETSKLAQAVSLDDNQILVKNQVAEDRRLLHGEVQHLSGDSETERLDCTLPDMISKYFGINKMDCPLVAAAVDVSSPVSDSQDALPGTPSNEISWATGGDLTHVRSMPVVGREKEVASSSNTKLGFGNEVIVNEIVHKVQPDLVDTFEISREDQLGIKPKIKETMERAFWDEITEALKQDEPDYGRVVRLVEEVRDELCDMAPQTWKEEILDSMDLDILHQVLESGNPDMAYLGRILKYALVTLQKLSAPADEDEIIKRHNKLLIELAEIANSEDKSSSSFVIAIVKGLRFVLEQIQILKREISKARIKIMEPIIRGPAGLEYLHKAFWDCYSDPSVALASLPNTKKWLDSVKEIAEQEWNEHMQAIAALVSNESNQSSQEFAPTALRAGGVIPSNANPNMPKSLFWFPATGDLRQDCKGEKVDILVRVGLLKLVIAIAGLTPETLPETFQLNFSRLRGVQGQLQKIIVLSTSLLVLRQILLSERSDTQAGVEAIVEEATRKLSELLDSDLDVGIPEIVQTVIGLLPEDKESERSQAWKEMMVRMLVKSLRDGDPVFSKVSRAVYQAMRGIVFGGTRGEKLAEAELRRVGSALLTKRVVEAAEVLVVVANVSLRVHGPWYATLTANM